MRWVLLFRLLYTNRPCVCVCVSMCVCVCGWFIVLVAGGFSVLCQWLNLAGPPLIRVCVFEASPLFLPDASCSLCVCVGVCMCLQCMRVVAGPKLQGVVQRIADPCFDQSKSVSSM